MREYHALLRELVRPGGAPRAPRLRDPRAYADLVRLQHRQPLAEVFGAARNLLGDKAFDALVEEFRAASPPTHPHPARWTRAFADFLCEREALGLRCHELVDYAATRMELALDDGTDGPFGAVGELRAYQHDPRGQGPCTLLIARAADGLLRTVDVDADMVAAWGALVGEVTREALAARGLDAARLARGEAALARALG